MREGCYDCTFKHLAQACVLLTEMPKGYPQHFFYVIGHLGEAEDEIAAFNMPIALSIREVRLKLLEDMNYDANEELESIAVEVNIIRLSDKNEDKD